MILSLPIDHRKGISVGRKTKLTEKQKAILRFYQRGKGQYILINGILSWGVVTGLLFLTIQSLWNNGLSFSAWTGSVFSGSGGATLLIFMAGGSLWGLWTWKQVEKNAALINESRIKGKPRRHAN